MGWLQARAVERGDPRELWPEAKTVVVLGDELRAGQRSARDRWRARDRGTISVYAQGRDYHELIKSRLKALARAIEKIAPGELKVFVDTAPVMEKPLAQRAGLGWQGKHTNLVSRALRLVAVSRRDLSHPRSAARRAAAIIAARARRCLDICPTRAFPAPYQLDARRCISYLTIEHKGHIAAELRPLIGNRIYGCDDCLAVCPWNKFAQAARETRFSRARDLRRAAPRGSRGARRCRVPQVFLRLAGQAHRPRPVCAQRADRDRQ